MEVGLPGRIGVNAVHNVVRDFKGGTDGGCETVQDLHRRWTNDILQHATAPYDMVSSMGYGCNVYLAFNVGILGTGDVCNVNNNCCYFGYDFNRTCGTCVPF